MTLKPKWTSESVGEYERSLNPIEQPRVRTGNCLRVGVCASEGHKIAPQRKPLTDEEIILIVAECAASHQHTDIHFARAIERAHGIKELV